VPVAVYCGVREFTMKDAYSFGTEGQFKDTYQKMWDTYKAIFEELGLHVDVVAADNGYIGANTAMNLLSSVRKARASTLSTKLLAMLPMKT